MVVRAQDLNSATMSVVTANYAILIEHAAHRPSATAGRACHVYARPFHRPPVRCDPAHPYSHGRCPERASLDGAGVTMPDCYCLVPRARRAPQPNRFLGDLGRDHPDRICAGPPPRRRCARPCRPDRRRRRGIPARRPAAVASKPLRTCLEGGGSSPSTMRRIRSFAVSNCRLRSVPEIANREAGPTECERYPC